MKEEEKQLLKLTLPLINIDTKYYKTVAITIFQQVRKAPKPVTEYDKAQTKILMNQYDAIVSLCNYVDKLVEINQIKETLDKKSKLIK